MDSVLEIDHLVTHFIMDEGVVQAVNGVSLAVKEGEVLAVVGESGCGKSVTMLSMLGLIPMPPGKIVAGQVLFDGRDLLKLDNKQMSAVRGKDIAMIFQDPMTSLNPVMSIGGQISEALTTHLSLSREEARKRTIELLDMVGIPEASDRMRDYPHEFSGGMRQRVMIAMALACGPRVLIADEPTTALDVTIQAQIVSLVNRLQRELGMAVIWITHDLGLVASLADRVVVMYAGRIVEEGSVDVIFTKPRHPYTQGLLRSVPRLDESVPESLPEIEGSPPNLMHLPSGCALAPRCGLAIEPCWETVPPLRSTDSPDHTSACLRWESLVEARA